MYQEPQDSDKILPRYHSVIESFKYVQSLFNNGIVNITEIDEELQSCYERLEMLISEESSNANSRYLDDMCQVKQLMLELIRIVQKKITERATAPPKISNTIHLNKESTDSKKQSIIENTREEPRVNSLDDIAGLWHIKKLLKTLVILPKNQPQLFVNCKACNSILLFGPPGTGKTHLVHALASEANAVLHCVSASSMLSPLVGQTEKNLQVLFEYVRNSEKFCILFIDEVDGFCRTRHNSEQDHTRRMKTELMCQMSKMENAKNMFLICATNCPWDLDTAFLRRFQRRIYIPLPNIIERQDLLQLFIKDIPLQINMQYWEIILNRTEGYSGSDISALVQSALNIPIMELEDTKIWKPTENGFYEPVNLAEAFDPENIIYSSLEALPYNSVTARPVQMLDLLNSLDVITPTVSFSEQQKYAPYLSTKDKY